MSGGVVSVAVLAASTAGADCCEVVKVDPEVPTVAVRVCENDGANGCGAVLYNGGLPLGAAEQVCPADSTLVYQEWDEALDDYGAPVVAVCSGNDVEL